MLPPRRATRATVPRNGPAPPIGLVQAARKRRPPSRRGIEKFSGYLLGERQTVGTLSRLRPSAPQYPNRILFERNKASATARRSHSRAPLHVLHDRFASCRRSDMAQELARQALPEPSSATQIR